MLATSSPSPSPTTASASCSKRTRSRAACRLEFRWKGVSLPYSAFDKDKRVTHAAITENKRLSAVLEFIKAEQDKAPPKKRRAGKQRTRYEPNGRRNDGWNSKLAKAAEKKRAASQDCDI